MNLFEPGGLLGKCEAMQDAPAVLSNRIGMIPDIRADI
jgi:hypothetical protein